MQNTDKRIKYVIHMIDEETYSCVDEFYGAFDDLTQAWDEAEYLWRHLTEREKKKRTINIMRVYACNLEDPDDWCSWTAAVPVKTFEWKGGSDDA